MIRADLLSGGEISYLGAFATTEAAPMVGYAVLGREPGTGVLMALLVRPEFRRRGIGSQLLAAVGDCAVYLGYKRLRLRVRRSNGGAQALYAGLSFVREGTERGYYADGEDAILMTARLPLGGRG